MPRYDIFTLIRELNGNSYIQHFTLETDNAMDAARAALKSYRNAPLQNVTGIKVYNAQDWEEVHAQYYVMNSEIALQAAPSPDTPIT